MELWTHWYWCASHLRPAFSRTKTFLWALLVLAGLSIRSDGAGVTSIVRALGLKEGAYHGLLRFFHSDAINLEKLVECWAALVMRLFTVVTVGDYTILILDGLKVSKEGKKMPAVKSLHQESSNNSKAEYIMGHSFQCLAILVTGIAGCMAAVPLITEIHEGLVWSNRTKRTLIDKAATLVEIIGKATRTPFMIVADAYYCNAKFIRSMLSIGCQLISRVRNNAVAYYPPVQGKSKKRGRPKKYGKKISLISLFNKPELFTTIESPVYGETGIQLRYLAINLLWLPLKAMVRFVLVDHPNRGRIILISSNLTLDPVAVISGYGYRYKIELSFKHALRVIGTYAYHFWMKTMDPVKRSEGNQYLHRKTTEYRNNIERKMRAYATHVTMGCIAQGLLLHLCMNHACQVWNKFGSWLRTMKIDAAPSELVAANALRTTLPDFIAGSRNTHAFKKFLTENIDPVRGEFLRLTG